MVVGDPQRPQVPRRRDVLRQRADGEVPDDLVRCAGRSRRRCRSGCSARRRARVAADRRAQRGRPRRRRRRRASSAGADAAVPCAARRRRSSPIADGRAGRARGRRRAGSPPGTRHGGEVGARRGQRAGRRRRPLAGSIAEMRAVAVPDDRAAAADHVGDPVQRRRGGVRERQPAAGRSPRTRSRWRDRTRAPFGWRVPLGVDPPAIRSLPPAAVTAA